MHRSSDGSQIWPFYLFQENLIHLQCRKCSLCRFCFSKAGKQEYSSGRTKAILADFPAQLNPRQTGKPLGKPGDSQHNPGASGDLSTGNRNGKVKLGKQQEQPLVWYFCTAASCLGWSREEWSMWHFLSKVLRALVGCTLPTRVRRQAAELRRLCGYKSLVDVADCPLYSKSR